MFAKLIALKLDNKDFDLNHNTQTLMLPILFCTYQFIEQILKVLLNLCTDQKYTNKIDELCSSFKEIYPDYIELIKLLDKYVYEKE